jgi:membrane protein implicated in regulation of membrane protease activity
MLGCALLLLPLLTAGEAQAYIGPGAGLTAIGTAVALVSALFLAIVGFVWYPIRRLLRKRRTAPSQAAPQAAAQVATKSDGDD